MTLVEFLEARIAEDEAEAKPMAGLDDDDRGGWAIVYAERVLAECAAKRAILDVCDDGGPWPSDIDRIERALAAIYKDHPDYRKEWA